MNVSERNPWIDPRVGQLRPEQARAYLLAQGWAPVKDPRPSVSVFEPPPRRRPPRSGIISVALVPSTEPGPEFLHDMIRLVAIVASHEDRWAVDVLADMLSAAPAAHANGAPGHPRRSARKGATG